MERQAAAEAPARLGRSMGCAAGALARGEDGEVALDLAPVVGRIDGDGAHLDPGQTALLSDRGAPGEHGELLALAPFAQCAAVRTLVGAIREPVQISRRFCSRATANCQPAGLALPPPTILGAAVLAPLAAEAPATKATQINAAAHRRGAPSPRLNAATPPAVRGSARA